MGVIQTGPGSAVVASNASGGYISAFNNIGSSAPVTVAGKNPNLRSITFHNPGTVDIFIAPLFSIINGSQVALVPTIGALGGCFRVFANGGTLTLEGEVQIGWQALAASGSGNPLTVMQSNV